MLPFLVYYARNCHLKSSLTNLRRKWIVENCICNLNSLNGKFIYETEELSNKIRSKKIF